MANPNGLADHHARQRTVVSSEFSQKFSSKQETYRFVASECQIYCDTPNVFTINHLKDIISGDRKTIKSKDVCQVHVPMFESLSTLKMLEWAQDYPEVFEILPRDQGEIQSLHRQYIANVIFYVAGKKFTDWIDEQLKKRTQKITQDRNLSIRMDPDIFKVYQQSSSISGKSLNFLFWQLFI